MSAPHYNRPSPPPRSTSKNLPSHTRKPTPIITVTDYNDIHFSNDNPRPSSSRGQHPAGSVVIDGNNSDDDDRRSSKDSKKSECSLQSQASAASSKSSRSSAKSVRSGKGSSTSPRRAATGEQPGKPYKTTPCYHAHVRGWDDGKLNFDAPPSSSSSDNTATTTTTTTTTATTPTSSSIVLPPQNADGLAQHTHAHAHPLLSFLRAHRLALDKGPLKARAYTWFHAPDFALTLPDGTSMPAGEASWAAFLERYSPFGKHSHELRACCVYDRGEHEKTWEAWCVLHVFANFKSSLTSSSGSARSNRAKVDSAGKTWDVATPMVGLFGIKVDKDGPQGWRIKSLKLFGDGLPVLGEMIKRGMIDPRDIR